MWKLRELGTFSAAGGGPQVSWIPHPAQTLASFLTYGAEKDSPEKAPLPAQIYLQTGPHKRDKGNMRKNNRKDAHKVGERCLKRKLRSAYLGHG